MLNGEHTSGALARPSLQVRGSLCPRGPALFVAHDDPEAHGSGWRRVGRRPFDPDGSRNAAIQRGKGFAGGGAGAGKRMRRRSSATEDSRRNASSGVRSSASASARRRSARDRKSTRLNSSHLVISYAVFCLKKKTT